MTKQDAVSLLKPLGRRLLHKVYDDLSDLQYEAILILCPCFEYPDWDYLTIGEFIRRNIGK